MIGPARLKRAEKTIADAKEFFVVGDLTLEEFADVVDREYRDALRLPKTIEQISEEFLRDDRARRLNRVAELHAERTRTA